MEVRLLVMTYDETAFNKHIAEEHKMSLLGDYVKEIVYGGTDGIVTTFAVVAGFSGAYLNAENTIQLSILTVLLFGLANLFADGMAMGLGNFISLRAEHSMYLAHKDKEWEEIQTNPKQEEIETIFLLMRKGLSEEDAKAMTKLYIKYPKYWLDFMMTEELQLQSTEAIKPFVNGLMTFLSFCFFGFIPIIPYLFSTDPRQAFTISIFSTLFALASLGLLSGWVTKRNKLWTISESILVGGTAAGIAYFVGTFFA
ncbi:GMP synthase [Candidatus Marinamargulisbacteria bacterium SCGC AAA071-K20]|nr:GMP synthase [Candidatus Marinamargulisbacteria bacterium SCGC AAA071-K20]